MGDIKLVVGLGNPGAEYVGTRHNIGFEVLDRCLQAAGGEFREEKKWEGLLGKAGGIFFLKPQTFMNLSGRSVASLARFYRWTPEQILVIYDDVALPLGILRFREGGGDGGHNGIKSVSASLGSPGYARLRFGVGASQKGELVGHVLGKFAPNEREELQNILATAERAVQVAVSQGIVFAANRFNVKKQPKNNQATEDEQEIRRSSGIEHKGEREECGRPRERRGQGD